MHGYAANAISNISVPSNLVSRVSVSDLMFEYHRTWNEFYEIAQITSSINWFGVCCAIFQIAINRCYEGDDDVNISNFSLNGNINNQFGQIFHDKNTHSIRNVAHKMFSIGMHSTIQQSQTSTTNERNSIYSMHTQ